MPQANPHQLLNTSWTLRRLSPLHHGKESQSLLDNPTALKTYSTRLRDQLTGDALGRLQAGIGAAGSGGGDDDDGDPLSKTGTLKTCTWETISASEENAQSSRGILVVLEYENITYKAALLAGLDNTPEQKGSTMLPLLLTRLPTGLQQTFISFLSTNFDTYCSLLRLPSNFMCTGLDIYVDSFLSSDATAILQDVIKDMQLTLSFSPSVAPALRSLNITIPRASFGEFLGNSPSSTNDPSPFLSNLSAYLDKHLAMELDLGTSPSNQSLAKQHVRLCKVACGGFVLGSEGRMKLVAGSGRTGTGNDGAAGNDEKARLELRASEALLAAVVRRAVAGEGQTK